MMLYSQVMTKSFVIRVCLSVIFIFSTFLLKPSFSFAVQDCRVIPPIICHNGTKNFVFDSWGNKCFSANWRVRGTVFCDSSDTGVCSGILYIMSGGVAKVAKPFSLPVGGRLDTNNTFSSIECSQMLYDAYCFDDSGPGTNYWFLPSVELVRQCPFYVR